MTATIVPITRLRTGSSRSRLGLGARAKTESMVRLPKHKLVAGRVHLQLLQEEGIDVDRPVTRGDCAPCPTCQEWRDAQSNRPDDAEGQRRADGARRRREGVGDLAGGHLLPTASQHRLACGHTTTEALAHSRPCLFVACSANLFLDTDEGTGSIKYNFPDVEPDDVPPEKSCALDVADQGGGTLEDIARTMNVTRERVRQIESKALDAVRVRARRRGSESKILREFSDAPADAELGCRSDGQGSVFAPKPQGAERDEAEPEDDAPTRISFFADPDSEDVDALVCASVWTMFAKDSNQRGIDCRSNQQRAQSKRVANERVAGGIVGTPPMRVEERTTMGEAKKRGEMLERTREALRTFESKHGRPPHPKELFDAMGAAVGKSVENVRMAMKRIAAQSSKTVRTPRAGHARPVKSRHPATPTKPAARVALADAKPSRTTSTDPTIAALIAKRDEFFAKAAALETAIETLAAGM